jgi:hypothetical protein
MVPGIVAPSMHSPPEPRCEVELYQTCGTGLIIEYPSGVVYTNQAGGTSCFQPEVEGVYIPFGNGCDENRQFLSMEIDLDRHWPTPYGAGITVEDADALDRILKEWQVLGWFEVDREQLSRSLEAWVHVNVKRDHGVYCSGFGPYPRKGILTWANSD